MAAGAGEITVMIIITNHITIENSIIISLEGVVVIIEVAIAIAVVIMAAITMIITTAEEEAEEEVVVIGAGIMIGVMVHPSITEDRGTSFPTTLTTFRQRKTPWPHAPSLPEI